MSVKKQNGGEQSQTKFLTYRSHNLWLSPNHCSSRPHLCYISLFLPNSLHIRHLFPLYRASSWPLYSFGAIIDLSLLSSAITVQFLVFFRFISLNFFYEVFEEVVNVAFTLLLTLSCILNKISTSTSFDVSRIER